MYLRNLLSVFDVSSENFGGGVEQVSLAAAVVAAGVKIADYMAIGI